MKLSLFDAYNTLLQRNSRFVFRGVLKTPSIPAEPSSNTVVYTVLDRTNVRAYLLALKSFLRYCPPLRVVVQSDGSIDKQCCAELQHHVPGIEIVSREDTTRFLNQQISAELRGLLPDLSRCCFFLPLKLLNVLYRFRNNRVILFDSDLLFLRNPEAVVAWIGGAFGQAFHLGGGNSLTGSFRDMGFAFETVDVGRFNAGFFGFVNSLDESVLLPTIRTIRQYDATLFHHWEIEQAIWAVLLNYCANPLYISVLQEGYVGNGWQSYSRLKNKAVLIHFVGATRFRNLMYPRLARSVIKELCGKHTAAHDRIPVTQ